MLATALTTENESLVKEKGKSKIVGIEEASQAFCREQIDVIISEVDKTLKKIKQQEEVEKQEYDRFGLLYKNLKALLSVVTLFRNKVQESIEEIENTFTTKLSELKLNAKSSYRDMKAPKLGELAQILVEIQLMLENMTLFEGPIQKALDEILNDYKKMMVKDTNAAIKLR